MTAPSKYDLTKIILERDQADLAMLKAVSNRPEFQIDNPAKHFAEMMKNGMYDDVPEELIACEAEAANILSDAWHDKAEINIFALCANLMKLLIEKSDTEVIIK